VELPRGQFRKGLRVKSMQGTDGIFELAREIANGRATFGYGEELTQDDPHIVCAGSVATMCSTPRSCGRLLPH